MLPSNDGSEAIIDSFDLLLSNHNSAAFVCAPSKRTSFQRRISGALSRKLLEGLGRMFQCNCVAIEII
jgi:hypothetical protein